MYPFDDHHKNDLDDQDMVEADSVLNSSFDKRESIEVGSPSYIPPSPHVNHRSFLFNKSCMYPFDDHHNNDLDDQEWQDRQSWSERSQPNDHDLDDQEWQDRQSWSERSQPNDRHENDLNDQEWQDQAMTKL